MQVTHCTWCIVPGAPGALCDLEVPEVGLDVYTEFPRPLDALPPIAGSLVYPEPRGQIYASGMPKSRGVGGGEIDFYFKERSHSSIHLPATY